MKSTLRPWSVRQIDEVKTVVKRELDDLETKQGAKERLGHALRHLKSLEGEESSEGMLKQFVYIISALVAHERHGGLTPGRIESLIRAAKAILTVQGVVPGKSLLSFMHGDLHLVLSQIFRRDGDHWRAAYEQELSHRSSRAAPSGGAGLQALAMAGRVLRLGYGTYALEILSAVESDFARSKDRLKAQFLSAKMRRLVGDLDRSSTEAAAIAVDDAATAKELAWERLCHAAQREHDLGPMLEATRRKGSSHRDSSFVLETYLWAFAMPAQKWSKELARPDRLAEAPELVIKRRTLYFRAIDALHSCYEHDIPLDTRLDRLTSVLFRTHELLTIDKEMLVWAGAARWLVRARLERLASLAVKRYESISLCMSDGQSKDTLGLRLTAAES